MSGRLHASMGILAVAVAVGLVAPVPVAGQTVPRTAWGQPDLQGVWDFRTLTPMERPDELADKQVLTAEEAAQFQQGQLADIAARDDEVPADIVGNYNQFWFDRGTTVVEDNRSSLVVDPPDGRIPPLTPAAEERKAAITEARRGIGGDEPTPGGWLEDLGPGGLRVRCILGFNSGPPMTPGGYNNNVQLIQTPDQVVILNEMNHNARVVPLDGRPHLGSHLRQWVGDSRGHWDGDTLVVDTTNFLRETVVFQGQTSADLHLVERFTRVDADTLLYEVTVDDPTTWTRPWTYSVPMMKNSEPIYEYACYEGNYAMETILAGARAKEQAAEQAK